jgi:hypothetical protein
MKLAGFSFKREAPWLLVFTFGIPLLGGLGYLIAWLLR